MKKVYYFLFVAIGLASCSNEDVFEAPANVNEDVAQEFKINRRSYSEVLEIAQNSISMIQDSTAITRGESGRTLNLESGVKTYCQKTTRANGASANDTLLYVFNFNDNRGFAVVSANRATEGLLAVVENGNYDPNSKWGDSYAEEILDNAKDYVRNIEIENLPAITRGEIIHWDESENGRRIVELTAKKEVAPRIKVKWAQKGAIATFCPNIGFDNNQIVGSGPIALAQAMTYWGAYQGYPTSIIYPKHFGGTLALDWKKINSWTNSDSLISNRTDIVVAKLVREIGYLAKADYYDDVTVTSLSNLAKATEKLGLNIYATSTRKFNPKNDGWSMVDRLWADNFAIMQAKNSKSGRAHTFVIDGFKYSKEHEYIQYKKPNGEIYRITF